MNLSFLQRHNPLCYVGSYLTIQLYAPNKSERWSPEQITGAILFFCAIFKVRFSLIFYNNYNTLLWKSQEFGYNYYTRFILSFSSPRQQVYLLIHYLHYNYHIPKYIHPLFFVTLNNILLYVSPFVINSWGLGIVIFLTI